MSNKLFDVVLVHGGFVDGSGWSSVYQILKKEGCNVTVAQNSTISLEGDVEVVKACIGLQNNPVILVGHSYGGVVITEAGNHPNVAALVYIAAFAPDAGESVSKLISNPPPGTPELPIVPTKNGFLFLDKNKFKAAFAADVDDRQADFMANSQVPWGVEALDGSITTPAWKTKPSWYLITGQDKMIPPEAQKFMSKRAYAKVTEKKGSHAIYVSQPEVVADLILNAIEELSTSSSSRASSKNSEDLGSASY